MTLYINPVLEEVRLDALKPHTVQSFYNRLQNEKHLSPKTIKNIHGVVHKGLQQAVLNGYLRTIPPTPAYSPRSPKQSCIRWTKPQRPG